jgi:hypothetical protein
MMMLKKKISHQQKIPNRILGLLRRTHEFQREDFKHTLQTATRTITFPQKTLIESSSIELELQRTTAILYANTIPPH